MNNILLDKIIRKSGSTTPVLIYDIAKDIILTPLTIDYIRDRIELHNRYKLQLEKIKQIPEIPQKSNEWYKLRENMFTASNFSIACGNISSTINIKEFIKKKCCYEQIIDTPEKLEIMQSGVKYEDVAVKLYELYNFTKVHQVGLIKYNNDERFGASPDGINDSGIMLEIKCPFKREINGSMSEQYYYQVQGQLEICNLDEADFAEFDFRTYETADAFYDDGEVPPASIRIPFYTKNMQDKGIIFELEKNQYIYTPLRLTKEEYKKFEEDTRKNNTNIVKTWYGYLNRMNTVRVYRDKLFWNKMYQCMCFIYDKIDLYKKNRDLYDNEI